VETNTLSALEKPTAPKTPLQREDKYDKTEVSLGSGKRRGKRGGPRTGRSKKESKKQRSDMVQTKEGKEKKRLWILRENVEGGPAKKPGPPRGRDREASLSRHKRAYDMGRVSRKTGRSGFSKTKPRESP